MCYFITIGIAERDAATVFHMADKALGATWQNNPRLQRNLGPDIGRIFTLSKGAGCCCSLYGPARNRGEHLRRKYAKKGWSQKKIERAVAASLEGDLEGLAASVRTLVAAAAERAGKVAVVVHWYSGTLDEERVTLAQGPRVTPEKLLRGEVDVGEDQILWVLGPGARRR